MNRWPADCHVPGGACDWQQRRASHRRLVLIAGSLDATAYILAGVF
jgi:hypothetical protein